MTPDDLIGLAERIRRLERVATAADTFLRHIAGFHITLNDGTVTDVFNQDNPDAVALQAALDDLRRMNTARQAGGK